MAFSGLVPDYLGSGLLASRPAAPTLAPGTVGLYYCTDVGSEKLTAWDGAAWADIAGGGGGMTNPMTTAEDIIVGGVAGAPARLGKGADGTFLGVVGGALAYATPSGSGTVTSVGSGTGLTGGPITASGSLALSSGSIASLALADTAVQPAGLSSYAPLASPTFTGNPAAPTPAAGDTDTSVATTAFVRTPALQSVTSSATVTPTFGNDMVRVTAQAAALALANPTGTAIPGMGMVIRIKDNGTARAISYDTQYRAIGVTLPTTTVISKTLYLAMIYNDTDTKWDVVAVAQEA